MVAARKASLVALKDDVNDGNALTMAQLSGKMQQAAQMMADVGFKWY